jgi:hypothetical protein
MADDRTMRVLLDDATLLESAETLGQALEAGRAAAERDGRVIVEVFCDGEPASADELTDSESLARPAIVGELSLVSAEPRELVAATFDDAAAALTDLRETQRDLAEKIQQGGTAEAVGALGEVFEVWEAARQALEQGAEMASIDLERDNAFADLIAGLTDRLKEVARTVEHRDWSTLADELEFELGDQAERWSKKFTELSATLRR